MFKAFTDNITAFMGTGKQSQEPSETQTEVTTTTTSAVDENGKSQSEITDVSVVEKAPASGDDQPQERRDSKVPPPRPAPPLTSGSSISKPDTPPPSPAKSVDGEAQHASADHVTAAADEETKKDKIDEKLEEVAEKAKQWGSYFYNMTKSAGASVSAKASELKKAVKENTIIGDFVKEQDKFVNENKEKTRAKEAAVPPWYGYNEEAQMKEQMLSLSNDRRNFLRSPPSGIQFHFDYETCFPVAMATLAEDENLQKMRFELVPKKVTEHDFWRNYFYRVSLIKQSTQLTSLAKQSSSSSLNPTESKTEAETTLSASNETKEPQELTKKSADNPELVDVQTELNEDADAVTGQDEFVSDAYNLEISDEDLIKEMEALRSSPGNDGDWEFEVVGGSNNDDLDIDEAALEKEIMDEMNKSTDDLK